jgi:hypothetical protein
MFSLFRVQNLSPLDPLVEPFPTVTVTVFSNLLPIRFGFFAVTFAIVRVVAARFTRVSAVTLNYT